MVTRLAKSKPIRLVVGLGNPGAEYERTRHNAGFWFVDALARQFGSTFRAEAKFQGTACRAQVGSADIWMLKPQSYMNRSGGSVAALAAYYKIDINEILVAHDELDMEPGVARLKIGGGHAGHNGLRDISSALGKDFARLRIGIGHPGDRKQVTNYVLGSPSRADADGIGLAIDDALRIVPDIIDGDMAAAMNRLHASPENDIEK